jgi:hypothetical protein
LKYAVPLQLSVGRKQENLELQQKKTASGWLTWFEPTMSKGKQQAQSTVL